MISPYSEQYWNMARTFAYYGFRMRDQSTILGFIWTLLYPLLLFIILFALFRQRLGADIPNFSVYLLIGIVHWNMFASATNKAVNSLVSPPCSAHDARGYRSREPIRWRHPGFPSGTRFRDP